MSDAARAKAMEILKEWNTYGEAMPDSLEHALDAYAAEQTAALRALVEKYQDMCAKYSNSVPQAMYVELCDLLADPEGQR